MNIKTKLTALSCVPLVAAMFFGQKLFLSSLYILSILILFSIADRKIFKFTTKTFLSVLIFILLTMFIGKVLGGYGKIKYYDKILHFLSGFLLVIMGRQIFSRLRGKEINKLLRKFFSFFFAVTGAALWEIVEFLSDTFLNTVAQNNSLTDTMLDITLGTLSALLAFFI